MCVPLWCSEVLGDDVECILDDLVEGHGFPGGDPLELILDGCLDHVEVGDMEYGLVTRTDVRGIDIEEPHHDVFDSTTHLLVGYIVEAWKGGSQFFEDYKLGPGDWKFVHVNEYIVAIGTESDDAPWTRSSGDEPVVLNFEEVVEGIRAPSFFDRL